MMRMIETTSNTQAVKVRIKDEQPIDTRSRLKYRFCIRRQKSTAEG